MTEDFQKYMNDFPSGLPRPHGSVMTSNKKTLKYAKISPLMLKLNELRKIEDELKKNQIDLLK